MRGEFPIAKVIHELGRDNLLPAIVFRTSRNQCDLDAEFASRNNSTWLSPPEQRELKEKIDQISAAYEMDHDLITSHPQYNGLVKTGVGAHHAGQLLMWRLLLEELMAAGCLRVLVATGTVAAGVDFPARTVVITAHSKRGAEGFMNLSAAEFQQMSGRAGRRGRDTVGFCVVAPAPFCDARALLRTSKQPPEPLISSYFPSPSTVLNLLRYRNVDDLRFTVDRSLAGFIDRRNAVHLREEAQALVGFHNFISEEFFGPQAKGADEDYTETSAKPGQPRSKEKKKAAKRIRRLIREAEGLEGRQLALLDKALGGLRKLGYLDGSSLSQKGYWAANLCTSLVLELGEVIQSGLVKKPTIERLTAIVASISGDPHRSYLEGRQSVLSKEDQNLLTDIIERVRITEMPGISDERKCLPAAAYTVITWLSADNWQEFRSLLNLAGVAEGDAARLITQTAEHLNQLSRLSTEHPELAMVAEQAKRRVLRPPLTEVLNLETS